MKRHYDYTLIDSRTGLSDVADICTMHLPDMLVDCFTLSDQGIDGAARVAHSVRAPVPARGTSGSCRCRCGSTRPRRSKADAGRPLAMQPLRRAAGRHDRGGTASAYWAAVRGARTGRSTRTRRPWRRSATRPGSPTSLLAAYETLTGILTDGAVTALPAMDEAVRARGKARFRRRTDGDRRPDRAAVRAGGPDLGRVDGARAQLGRRCGWSTRGPPSGRAGTPGAAHADRGLAGLRGDAVGRSAAPATRATGSTALAVYVADLRPLAEFPSQSSDQPGQRAARATAVERVLRLVGRPVPSAADGPAGGGARYPGAEPVIFNAPGRNARFTGREDDLARLRAQLQSGRRRCRCCRSRCRAWAASARPSWPWSTRTGSGPRTTWSGGSTRTRRSSSTPRSPTSPVGSASLVGPSLPDTRPVGAAGARPWRAVRAVAGRPGQRRGARPDRALPAAGPRPRPDHLPQPRLGRPGEPDPGGRLRARRRASRTSPSGCPRSAPRRPTGSPRRSATCRSRWPRPAPGSPTPARRSPTTCGRSSGTARERDLSVEATWDLSLNRLRDGRPPRTGCCSCARCWPRRSPST